jgi:hypothetical protein
MKLGHREKSQGAPLLASLESHKEPLSCGRQNVRRSLLNKKARFFIHPCKNEKPHKSAGFFQAAFLRPARKAHSMLDLQEDIKI